MTIMGSHVYSSHALSTPTCWYWERVWETQECHMTIHVIPHHAIHQRDLCSCGALSFIFIQFICVWVVVLYVWNIFGNGSRKSSIAHTVLPACRDIVFLIYSELTGSRRCQTLSIQHLNGIVLMGCQRCVLPSTKSYTCRLDCRVNATGINSAFMKNI